MHKLVKLIIERNSKKKKNLSYWENSEDVTPVEIKTFIQTNTIGFAV